MKQLNIFLFVFVGFLVACNGDGKKSQDAVIDFRQLPPFDEEGYVNVVVEIPAGTNHEIEYNHTTNAFERTKHLKEDRVIEYIAYPGNYGFVCSTLVDEKTGGDGDALDVLVLSESQPTGTVMKVIPIAMISLLDDREIADKIIAVPAKIEDRTIYASSFTQLETDFPGVKSILIDWFTNYKGRDRVKFAGWRDEKVAVENINKWTVAE